MLFSTLEDDYFTISPSLATTCNLQYFTVNIKLRSGKGAFKYYILILGGGYQNDYKLITKDYMGGGGHIVWNSA